MSRSLLSRLFLGKWWHWLILIVIVALMWLAGQQKMHVINFNLFVCLLLLGTIMGVFSIVRGTSAGDQVTRDPIVDDYDGDESEGDPLADSGHNS